MQPAVKIECSPWMRALRPAPAGVAVAAIGDVHGQAHLLAALHDAIADEFAALSCEERVVVHLGDYIDRGPESCRSMELARNGISGTENVVLIGNHEDILLTILHTAKPAACEKWLQMGGTAMLAELGIEQAAGWVKSLGLELGEELVAWLDSLPHLHQVGEIVFVHGGLKPGKALGDLARRECIWIWDEWIADDGPYVEGVGVIHGHIPIDEVELNHPHKLNVDTQAHASNRLTAVVVHGNRMRLVQTL